MSGYRPRPGLVVAPHVLQQRGEVDEVNGIVRMRRADGLRVDLQRLAVERLGLGIPAKCVDRLCVFVQSRCEFGRFSTKFLARDADQVFATIRIASIDLTT